MAISPSQTYTDTYGREIKRHGTEEFPAACYKNVLAGKEIGIHWHEEQELIIVREGIALLRTSNGTFQCSKGMGIFINSNVLHTVEAEKGKVCIDSVVFHPSFLGGEKSGILWKKYIFPLMENSAVPYLLYADETSETAEIVMQIDRAWHQVAEEPEGYEISVRNTLSEVLLHIWQHAKINERKFPFKDKREERLKAMLEYIHSNYSEHITVQQIAEAGFISKSECLRCFRDGLAITPMRYVNDYRIKAAAGLLQTTDWSVTDIGEKCGFLEMGYFAGKFKKQYGCTPSAYRKRMQVAADR